MCEYEPDIVHAHDLEVLDVAANIKNKLGSKIIFDSHEDWPMLEKVQNWFVGKYYERKLKKLIGNVDALLTVSDELAVRLEGGTVLYNSELLKTVEKPVLHDRFGLNGIVAGYIGALRKPILEEILEAASKVNALSVLIVGGAPKGQAGYTNMIKELEELAVEKAEQLTERAQIAEQDHIAQWEGSVLEFEMSLYKYVCDSRLFLRSMPLDENVTFLLKGLGEESDSLAGHSDKLHVLRNLDVKKCQTANIDPSELLELAHQYSL